MLLLNINRKPYIGSPLAPPHLTLSDIQSKGQSQGHRDFESLLYLVI